MHRWARRGLGVLASTVAVLGSSAAAVTDAGAAVKKPPKLTVLVTSDEGVDAPGLDALVNELRLVKNTKVVVVAPANDERGTGSKTTPGSVTSQSTTTASGYPATAVEGYPADAVITALDSLQVHPNVVISGISRGQSLGPIVDESGTVGAAREAARRGIPALAVSQGTEQSRYDGGARLALAWLRNHRSDLLKKPKRSPSTVDNLNVPSCPSGAPRGLVHVDLAPTSERDDALHPSIDCTRSVSTSDLRDDVQAFTHGYATLTAVPASEAS